MSQVGNVGHRAWIRSPFGRFAQPVDHSGVNYGRPVRVQTGPRACPAPNRAPGARGHDHQGHSPRSPCASLGTPPTRPPPPDTRQTPAPDARAGPAHPTWPPDSWLGKVDQPTRVGGEPAHDLLGGRRVPRALTDPGQATCIERTFEGPTLVPEGLAITSAPGECGETTDQPPTTTAELSAPQRSTRDTSEKWLPLDDRGSPIWGSIWVCCSH